jgi:hypothetical protein
MKERTFCANRILRKVLAKNAKPRGFNCKEREEHKEHNEDRREERGGGRDKC